MKILGHRGASADYPENTVEAMLGAVEQRAHGVELDVMQCATGELVVCHDEWLDRLAHEHLEVARTPLKRLLECDVGSPLGFAPARIPLLADVFDALPKDFMVNVEIKCDAPDDQGLAVKVGQFITEHRLGARVLLSSFNPQCLVRLGRAFPKLKWGLLIDPDKPWLGQAWGWLPLAAKTSVHPHFAACTPERVARWKRQKLEIAVWTVDDLAEARRLEALGVDYLITNRPGLVRRGL